MTDYGRDCGLPSIKLGASPLPAQVHWNWEGWWRSSGLYA